MTRFVYLPEMPYPRGGSGSGDGTVLKQETFEADGGTGGVVIG